MSTAACKRVRPLLGPYGSGELDRHERSEVDYHLLSCEDCRGELAALDEVPALLAPLRREAWPVDVVAPVLERLRPARRGQGRGFFARGGPAWQMGLVAWVALVFALAANLTLTLLGPDLSSVPWGTGGSAGVTGDRGLGAQPPGIAAVALALVATGGASAVFMRLWDRLRRQPAAARMPRAGSLPERRQEVLATAPIVLYTATLLFSRFWAPLLFGRGGYTWLDLGLLLVLLAGAVWGLRRGAPLWSYTWIMFLAMATLDLAIGVVGDMATGFSRQRAAFAGAIWMASLPVAVILAGLLGRRGVRYGVFALLLALLYQALPFTGVSAGRLVSTGTAWFATIALLAAAVIEAAVGVMVVMSLLRPLDAAPDAPSDVAHEQRRRLRWLVVALLADALLAGWATALRVPGLGYLPALSGVAWSWGILAIGLLGAWGLSKLMVRVAGPRSVESRDKGGGR